MAHVLELTVESFFFFGIINSHNFIYFLKYKFSFRWSQDRIWVALYTNRFGSWLGARPKV